ncbi:Iron-sulfur cluster assembly 2 homolog, mitochondrial [Eumeta japonica]|uniref:Iron-sulfur cluster assembly 2 homolog, mitochondrial n=1 Tax=Eumeta variegata TaxID=151549 RepID=A0A4C1WXW3_EUMVA|nr:Iron-sulfur cluster assembly 2 homolog, mitochondrial [Eumeta japonica]
MMRSTAKRFLGACVRHRQRSHFSTLRKENGSLSSEEIVISDSCVQRLKQLCENDEKFLRITVDSGGCSGFQYKFDLDNKVADEDRVFEREGVKLVVDETSLEYIKGATVDYHTELIRSAFRVMNNPNADLGCSCGASFSIKIE